MTKPRTLIFPNEGEHVSVYSVWIYPYDFLTRGARVVFFHAEQAVETVCYMYIPDSLKDKMEMGGGEKYKNQIDQTCDIALEALAEKGIILEEREYLDIHIDEGELDPADLEDEDNRYGE